MRRVPNSGSGQSFKCERGTWFVRIWIVRSLMRSSSRDLRVVRRILDQTLFLWFEGSEVEPTHASGPDIRCKGGKEWRERENGRMDIAL